MPAGYNWRDDTTIDLRTPRRSERGHATDVESPPELQNAYAGTGGPRIASPHHDHAARRMLGMIELTQRGAALKDLKQRGAGGKFVKSKPLHAAARTVSMGPYTLKKSANIQLTRLKAGARVEANAPPPWGAQGRQRAAAYHGAVAAGVCGRAGDEVERVLLYC